MRKNSISGSSNGHNMYCSSSHVQDFYKQSFCACAKLILEFSCARLL